MKKTWAVLFLVVLECALVSSAFSSKVFAQAPGLLDPLTIPMWVNQLQGPPPVYVPTNITDSQGKLIRQDYVVNVTEFYQQILPTVHADGSPTGFGPTKVWGYGGVAKDALTGENLGFTRGTPGPTFEAIRGVPVRVKWVNDLVDAAGNPLPSLFAVDPTLHWANPNNINMTEADAQAGRGLAPPYPPGYNGQPYTLPDGTVTNPDGWNAQSPVPIVTHLHGGEVPSASDGGPEEWYTANGIHGPAYNTVIPTDSNAAVYQYPNTQPPTTLWYHDHALGQTRINVMSGLAGFYLLRDPSDSVARLLPAGKYDMPLAIQDRSFLTDGSLYYSSNGSYPDTHPYWQGSQLGNTIMVNGKVWPNMNVDQGQYLFRILDGSNDRFYELSFSNRMSFIQIGSDGGYLKAPVTLTSLLIAPAERADIIVDFSKLAHGEKVILENTALISSSPEQTQTLGQIMQFTVTGGEGSKPFDLANVPNPFNPTLTGSSFPTLPNATKQRILTLVEIMGSNGLEEALLDGQTWSAPISEKPQLGTTEDWVIVNPTMDAHPIHLHLIQFQLVQRVALNSAAYTEKWTALNGDPPFNYSTINVPSLTPYLSGPPNLASPNEQGWKDTIIVNSGEVVTIRVRFTQEDGSAFPFDATAGPGYVWHCHLLDHEDNEMMRPYMLTNMPESVKPVTVEVAIVAGAVLIVVVLGFIFLRHRRVHPGKN